MANNTNIETHSRAYNLLSPSASVDANYGPWTSTVAYENWLKTKGINTVNNGTLIAIENPSTGDVTLKIRSGNNWKDVCNGNHEEGGDEPTPDPTPTPEPEPEPELTAKLKVTLTATPTSGVVVGDTITYTAKVTNIGDVRIINGTLTSSLVSSSSTFSLNPSESKEWKPSYVVKQTDVDSGIIRNTVTAKGNSSNSSVADPADVPISKEVYTENASAKITVTKTADAPDNISVGTVIPYTVVVKNTGNVTVNNCNVGDSLAALENSTNLTLAPGATKTFSYNYTVKQTDIDNNGIVNVATATAKSVRGDHPSQATSTSRVAIDSSTPEPDIPSVPKASMSATLTADNSGVNVGNIINYAVTVTNTGTVKIVNGTVYNSIKNESESFSIEPNEIKTFTHSYTATQADLDIGYINNIVTISGKSSNVSLSDPETITLTKKVTTRVATARFEISKVATVPLIPIEVGTDIAYTILVKNAGNVTIKDIAVTDDHATLDNSTGIRLAPGESKLFYYNDYKVTQTDINNGRITNVAAVTGTSVRGTNPGRAFSTCYVTVNEPNPYIGRTVPAIEGITYVDLGLESGTLWATCNLGANNPAGIGYYVAWGELEEKSNYSWSTYKYCNGTNTSITKYCFDSNVWAGSGSPDQIRTLKSEDDLATQLWGEDWSMPTQTQLSELMGCPNTKIVTKLYDGKAIKGLEINRIFGLPSIFLPISGYLSGDTANIIDETFYWSKTNASESLTAKALKIYTPVDREDYFLMRVVDQDRCYGITIRPVCRR